MSRRSSSTDSTRFEDDLSVLRAGMTRDLWSDPGSEPQ
jgi:hypothetical protein